MNVLFTLFVTLCFILAGCGGGGSGGADPIAIGAPDVSETDLSEIYLSGTSFVPEGSYCYLNQTILFRAISGVYSITWENLANNLSGTAQIWPYCDPEISWSILPAIALVPGENQITVTVTTDDEIWQDSITVTRVPDITPPTIFSWFPGETSTYNGVISFTFNEPIEPASLLTNVTLRNTATNTLAPGVVSSVGGLSQEFRPDTALEPNTNYIVHIEGAVDMAGNVMSEPFEWTFTTGL